VVWRPVAPSERGAGGPGGGGFGGRGGARLLTGAFTARLTAGGKSYTQTFSVLPDPTS